MRTYLDAKSRHLAAHSDIEHVLILSGDRDVTIGSRPRVHFVRGPEVPGSPGYHAMWRARRVRALIRQERPDVIELGSHFLGPWVVGDLARELGAALVGFYHTDVLGVWLGHGLSRVPRVARRAGAAAIAGYLRAAYGRCDVVVAATEWAARSIGDVARVRVEVVPLGVDTRLFHPDRRSAALRRELGAGPGTPLLIYAGRLSREKELETVLRGFPRLHEASGARWIVVGEGHLRTRLAALAARHPEWLALLPFERDRERLAALYASSDAYVSPGPYETFGLAAHEAVASGLPVIGVDAGAMAEVLRGNPNARLYRQRDPEDFVRAALSLLAECAKALPPLALRARSGRRAPSAEYPHGAPSAEGRGEVPGWEATFDRLAELYREACGISAGRRPRSRSPRT